MAEISLRHARYTTFRIIYQYQIAFSLIPSLAKAVLSCSNALLGAGIALNHLNPISGREARKEQAKEQKKKKMAGEFLE